MWTRYGSMLRRTNSKISAPSEYITPYHPTPPLPDPMPPHSTAHTSAPSPTPLPHLPLYSPGARCGSSRAHSEKAVGGARAVIQEKRGAARWRCEMAFIRHHVPYSILYQCAKYITQSLSAFQMLTVYPLITSSGMRLIAITP